jgi:hypothetical protein
MVNTTPAISPAGQDGLTVRRLRLGVGVIAAVLPFAVLLGNMAFAQKFTWLGSISGSYYTEMRGVFVGSLCAIGVFLIAYRYQRLDDIWSTVGGFLAIVVALFPTTPGGTATDTQVTVGTVHFAAATALFSVLAFFCLYIFTRLPLDAVETPRKKTRNLVYRVTGAVIALAIVVAAVTAIVVPSSVRYSWNTLFWCETAAILAFAIAWLTKGGAFPWWNDPSAPEVASVQRREPRDAMPAA